MTTRRVFLQTAAAALPLYGDTSQTIYLTDLDRCQPAAALSRKPRRGHWRLLDFETDRCRGAMLVAGHNTAAPEVRYAFGRPGWYGIWFGLRSYAGIDQTHLEVRLTRDPAFCRVIHQPAPRSVKVDEYFWKCADLTRQELHLRQFVRQVVPDNASSVGNASKAAWLVYIKLVPLRDEEVRAIEEERRGGRHRRLFAHHDAWSYTYEFRPTRVEDIRREIEPFRDTDFARLYWECGAGDRMYYPSKRGLTAVDDWIEDPYRQGDRLAAETWQAWRKQGIDPFRTALDYTQSLGVEFHATYRPAGFHFPVPEDEWNSGGVYDRHPEWRGRDRQNRPTPRLSYAYPEVRQVALQFLGEVLDAYPVDGVCMAYNRRPPLVEYEAPVVEGFRRQYGQDPRQLDDRDPRWLKHRAGVLTGFMREVRRLLDEAGRKRNRRMELTAIVAGSERENLFFAMDVEDWIRQGVVDTLVPYSSAERLYSGADSWTNPRDAEFFLRIAKGTPCKLALNLMPRQLPPEEYRKRAHALYEAGAQHLFFWDTNARYDFSPSWSALRRLGHREELQAWARAGSPAIERPGTQLRKLGDWDLSYDTPG